MILFIDMGNSRCKWVVTDQKNGLDWLESGSWDNHDFLDTHWKTMLRMLSRKNFAGKTIEQVFISSVASQEIKQQVSEWFESVLDITPVFAQSQEQYEGQHSLINSYPTPKALGVDRWLAMIGALEVVNNDKAASKSFAVIDAGTAITLDLVNERGQHLGGHIVPGHNLMQQALLGDTGQIAWSARQDNLKASDEQWIGQNTQQAVELGCLQASQAYVQSVVSRMKSVYDVDRIYFTGGDGKILMDLLQDIDKQDLIFSDDLVLQGLYHWSQNNH